jgi:hypothetical protein
MFHVFESEVERFTLLFLNAVRPSPAWLRRAKFEAESGTLCVSRLPQSSLAG